MFETNYNFWKIISSKRCYTWAEKIQRANKKWKSIYKEEWEENNSALMTYWSFLRHFFYPWTWVYYIYIRILHVTGGTPSLKVISSQEACFLIPRYYIMPPFAVETFVEEKIFTPYRKHTEKGYFLLIILHLQVVYAETVRVHLSGCP